MRDVDRPADQGAVIDRGHVSTAVRFSEQRAAFDTFIVADAAQKWLTSGYHHAI